MSSLALACEAKAPESAEKPADAEKSTATASPGTLANPEVKTPEAKKPGDEGSASCETYFQEVADLCRTSLNDGVEVSCFQLYMFARMAQIQSRGAVFKSPDGKLLKPKEASTSCEAPLLSLRKQRNEAKTGDRPAWGPTCTKLILKVDLQCLAPLTTGKFVKSCDKSLQVLSGIKPGEASEVQCEAVLPSLLTSESK